MSDMDDQSYEIPVEETSHEAPPPDPEEIITALMAEVADLRDQLLRSVAEGENVRRRAAREKLDASKFAIASLARDLLAVPDTLDRAIDSVGEDVRAQEGVVNLIEGMELTQRQLLGIFERHGIKPIHPMGEKFDPNFHQAMFEAPGTGQPDGTIVQILQMGYVIGDRLLRPAMVGVAKGGGQNAGAPGNSIDTSV
ncbi:MAG: nucleotide exchange factor GrpE [Alphaproteobacteria bacterium]